MDAQMKSMSLKEFRESGLLQELNRTFLHPLGLAMMVRVDEETGETAFGSILDCRDDPEGFYFGEDDLSAEKAHAVEEMRAAKAGSRSKTLGWIVQPVPVVPPPVPKEGE